MTSLSFRIETRVVGLDALARPLDDLAGGAAHPELLRGLRDGGAKLATIVRRALRDQMGVKSYGTILRHTRSYLAAGDLAYVIEGQGKGLPIAEFKGLRVARPGPQPRDDLGRYAERPDNAGGVSASPWNVFRRFKRSYMGRRGQPVARRPDGRVRALYGPSPAKEIVQGQALDAFHAGVVQHVQPAVERRLARLFG